jgi:hypothetical protein
MVKGVPEVTYPTLLTRTILTALVVLTFAGATSPLSAAVDPTNMGKGDWIWMISSAQSALGVSTVQGVIDYEKNKGMKWIVVKCAQTGTWMSQFNSDLITRAHNAGMLIFGYERCFGDNVTAEVNAGKQCLALGADGFIIDAEAEYEGKKTQATSMMSSLRASYPNAFIAHAPFPYIDYHTSLPYVEFGKKCNAVMPQCYWKAIGVTPTKMVTDLDAQWKKWHTTWTNQGNGAAVKPIVPIGQGYDGVPGSEITTFVNALKNDASPATAGGYKGVSFWSCQHHNSDEWSAIGAATIGGGTTPPGTAIIVDNSNSGFSASTTWSTGTSATDKYGTNYRYRSTEAVSDQATWTFTVSTAGNYEVFAWWSQGTNRSSTATYTVPTGATVTVNQQANGGKWNSLGVYNLTAGTKTIKLSCWTTVGYVIIADAVKLEPR